MELLDEVTQQLKSIDLEDDDISQYIVGIVQDDSLEENEKAEVIREFLAETTDKSSDSLISTILSAWEKVQHDLEKRKVDLKSQQVEQARALEKERLMKAEKEREELARLATEVMTSKQLSREQKLQRDRLKQQYDDLDEISRDDGLIANNNAASIIEKERARREEMKKQTEKEKERNKMLLEKQRQQKLDKENENKKKSNQKKDRKRI